MRRRRSANQPHETGGCLPLLAAITGVATALQASSNTYPNGLTPRQQTAALWRLCTTFDEGKSSMRRKPIKAHNGKPVKDAAPVMDPSLENLAAVLEQIARMDALPLASSPRRRRRRRRCAA